MSASTSIPPKTPSGIMYFWFGNRKATVDVDGTRTGSPNNRQHGGNEEDEKDE